MYIHVVFFMDPGWGGQNFLRGRWPGPLDLLLALKQVLWTETANVWHGVDQTIIDNALDRLDEWHERLCACVRAKGRHFWATIVPIFSHMTTGKYCHCLVHYLLVWFQCQLFNCPPTLHQNHFNQWNTVETETINTKHKTVCYCKVIGEVSFWGETECSST